MSVRTQVLPISKARLQYRLSHRFEVDQEVHELTVEINSLIKRKTIDGKSFVTISVEHLTQVQIDQVIDIYRRSEYEARQFSPNISSEMTHLSISGWI